MKKIIIVLLALIALGVGGWFLNRKLFKSSNMEAITMKVTEGTIEETVNATGSVSPLNRVEVKPTIAGRIEKLLVNEGDKVAQGQIIAWMSSTDRAAILDGARAQGPAVLKKWQDVYKPTPIIAPLPGLIILRNVVEGQTVDTSVVIYAMSDILIVIGQVDESDIGRIHLGMPARVVLDSYPDKEEMGKVFDILYEGKNVSNVIQYSVKIKLDKVPAYDRSQMTANISFIIQRKDKALLVPASAVNQRNGAKEVLIPNPKPGGKPIWQEVTTGIENDTSVEILSGLAPNQPIMIRQAKYTPQQGLQSSPLNMNMPSGRTPGGGGGGGGRH